MITLTDLFCGAGGSSTGATQVPGVQVLLAANHWPLAVETHNANHPDTDHDCADLSQVDPRRYRRTDILWASPECTNHSVAKGRRRNIDATPDLFGEVLPNEAAERSRATMWDVVRFAEHHRYRAVVVENVVDAAKWVLFDSWLTAMKSLGYRHRIVYLNSMHAQAGGTPAPQSRDRMYVVFWRAGESAPDLDRWTRPRAWCPNCEREVTTVQAWKNPARPWGRYRAQYAWRCPSVTCRNTIVEPAWLPAATVIDWNLRGQRIGDRAKPLAAKTLARIQAGLDKYASIPVLVPAGGTWRETGIPLTAAMPTRTTARPTRCWCRSRVAMGSRPSRSRARCGR
jgi:DNA (cytosine-5)-methyltransferase 1